MSYGEKILCFQIKTREKVFMKQLSVVWIPHTELKLPLGSAVWKQHGHLGAHWGLL